MIYDNKTIFLHNSLYIPLLPVISIIMEIKQHDTEKNGNFYIEENGKTLAIMTYVYAGDHKFIIDHTQVPDALRGRGVGQALVLRAVQDARREAFKIIPLCPFAKAQFDRHEDWRDVLST